MSKAVCDKHQNTIVVYEQQIHSECDSCPLCISEDTVRRLLLYITSRLPPLPEHHTWVIHQNTITPQGPWWGTCVDEEDARDSGYPACTHGPLPKPIEL